jgi:ketosteroid isomerase-like protein
MTISLDLPATITAFLTAHTRRDADAAIRSFTTDAVVVDDGSTYRGTAAVLDFLRRGGSEFTYTTSLVGAQRIDDERWTATNHLEGDFPGGVVDLVYRFTLRDDLISELTIAP